MIEVVTAISLWELVKHAGSWVVNLQRARTSRKAESVEALRKVVIAARHTAVYMRQLQDTGQRSHKKEEELAILWTELSFALEDLGMDKLAKRCRIKGKEWADPQSMDVSYLEKADAGLERMEQLANALLKEILD
ncbi:hypothetical protein [Marinobacter zhejiangensis]|uniref:Uncharacterized protein n=1 Tax=Marinobacter zhejiangensis TaxID=488535 RepID=A0A1I4RE77_9GAMM|nr:hypothetical protein [Marinobacter zhejiangensis]SFM50517.1 hypothetical protein SAMN04487963_2710 [Marinobacter zhejiangensis]